VIFAVATVTIVTIFVTKVITVVVVAVTVDEVLTPAVEAVVLAVVPYHMGTEKDFVAFRSQANYTE
jgi:hypothetical protein